MTTSVDAMTPRVTAGSIKGMPRGSGLLSLGLEERSLDDRRGRPMPLPLDRHFDLDARARPRIRSGDGGDRDVPLQQRRPATARGPTDLAVPRVQWHFLAPGLGGRLGWKTHVPIEALHRLPVDLQADRPSRWTAAPFLEERLPPDERAFVSRDGPVQAELQRRVHLRVDDRLPRWHVFDLCQNEARLDPCDIQREHPRDGDVMPVPLLHDGVPQ